MPSENLTVQTNLKYELMLNEKRKQLIETLAQGFAKLAVVIAATFLLPITTSAAPTDVTAVDEVQQVKVVKGKVVDETGEPMIGVTVKARGGKEGTVTDLSGQFQLSTQASQLELSYVGYKSQVVAARDGQTISMKPDHTTLDDVVVVGYGTMKKRDLTGAISSVKQEEIRRAPVLNAMEGLQGKIAGLDITRSSGAAGTSPSVLLRGNRSILGDCSPLYVIDGVAGGSLDNLNPNDIESIEVLKDASSTAIYGSAGANGVIIITTRQGIKGKTQVDFNAYLGVNAWPSFPGTLQGDKWIQFLDERFYQSKGYRPEGTKGTATYMDNLVGNEGLNFTVGTREAMGLTYDEDGNAVYNPAAAQWVSWKDEVIQTGVQQNYNISVRGGGEKLQSYMSMGYQQEKGLYRKDQAQLMTFRSGANYQVNNIVSLGYQSTISYRNRDKRPSRLSKSLTSTPLGKVWNEDGTLNIHPIYDNDTYINIMADDVENVYESNSKNIHLSIAPFVELRPLKGLSLRSMANVGYSNSRNATWDGLNTYYKLSGSQVNKRKADYNTGMSWSVMWQNVLTYNFKLADVHDITLTGISEYGKSFSEKGEAHNEDMNYDVQKWYNLQDGKNPSVKTDYSDKATMAWAARVHYSYLSRYLLTASLRHDGSSVLYKKKRWSTFPSVALAWRMSDENFMDFSKEWLDDLKLRVGYGVTGNANISPYSSQTLVESSANTLNLGGAQVSNYVLTRSVANYDLTWEKSYNWNLGLDFTLLNNRIDGSIELYSTDTKGVLYNRELPTVFGSYNAKTPYTKASNIARIKNRGIEVTLNTRNIQTKDFQWNSTLTFMTNNEKLKEIDLGNSVTVSKLVSLELYLDNPTKTLYGYKKVGIWQQDEAEQAICFDNKPGDVKLLVNGSEGRGLTWDPNYTYTMSETDPDTGARIQKTHYGAFYEDIMATGERKYYTGNSPYSVSSATDRMILGHTTPDWSLGFQNQFIYRDFDLTIQAFMRWGQTINGKSDCLLGVHNTTNIPECFEYWTESNPTNAYPRVHGQSTQAREAMGFVDGSYIKIKNITLGYTLPSALLKKMSISKMRLYATITNPFIWAKEHDLLKGMDPESNCSDEFPLYRTLVFGLNVSF